MADEVEPVNSVTGDRGLPASGAEDSSVSGTVGTTKTGLVVRPSGAPNSRLGAQVPAPGRLGNPQAHFLVFRLSLPF